MPPGKPPRFVLTSFPERYVLPSRPSGPAHAQDAHRQTGFLLGDDLGAFEAAMNLQLRMVEANAKAKGPAAAATFTLWSRAFSHLADACTLMSYGSYVSCAPLLRAALDAIAVQRSLGGEDFAEYTQWLEIALSQDKAHAALAVDLGRYKAASALIDDERLGTAYQLLMALSMPHFGSALLLSAPEVSLAKLPASFADNAFHLGWAELMTSWLLLLAGEQMRTLAASSALTISRQLRADIDGSLKDIEALLGSRRRCYVEESAGRFVLHNFRRSPSGQPKRIVLG
jgi:hypothetical protein